MLFSIHGLIRGNNPELGRDADTGGQVQYVLELARCLGKHPAVARVDLVTRLICDKTVSPDYCVPVEPLGGHARLLRLQCGGRRYLRKELLWPHLDEFVDKTLKLIRNEGQVPDICHGHYADGGYVARELAAIFGLPFIFTGHSMGRHKKNKLLTEGFTSEEINRRYHIDRRIGVEERIIKDAEKIITSTSHEITKQYGLYHTAAAGSFEIIPPGIDVDNFYPYYQNHPEQGGGDEISRQTRMVLLNELHRFWVATHKPFILALCRPDQRKNIAGLITAYGESKELQAIANLAIFAGIRKDIGTMEENERGVLTEMLLLMDRYDLYGKLAIPKRHNFATEVPELYRLCADSQGVFVNPALVEPFGITLLEAAACGVPIVATQNGGPTDIIGNCENGLLIDPSNSEDIARACRDILVDRELWQRFSSNGINGVRRHYVWQSHCDRAVEVYQGVRRQMPVSVPNEGTGAAVAGFGRRLVGVERLLITDIDDTLIGDDQALGELLEILAAQRQRLAWGVATGRSLERTREILTEYGVVIPDIVIASVGTEIYYGRELQVDKGWQQHLAYQWKPAAIREELAGFSFLEEQEEQDQRPFKISYFMEDDPELLARVHQRLHARKLRYNLIYSGGQFLDILPFRASKGKAVRYLSYKWEVALPHIMVCGDSGNDEEMLRGDTSGLVVGNYRQELAHLKGMRRMFFSPREYAAGIIDGLHHFKFI